MADVWGWIYCLSNPVMPGILKIGMTERTPEERVKELFTTGVPCAFKIEFAVWVKDPRGKETSLHTLLEQYTDRISLRREFFRVSPEEVRKFFDLMDGKMWSGTPEEEDEDEDEDADTSSESAPQVTSAPVKGCRDMAKCFTHGQRIRHKIGINKIWIGTYNSSKNGIECDGKLYTSLSNFAVMHVRVYNPTRKSTGGWKHCECEVEGKWVSTHSLPG
jgi:T5orf172 domain